MLAERLLAPIREAKVDTLLLGCTHYPFLARTISDVVGREVVLVSSADESAFELRATLAGTDLSRRPRGSPGTHTWISSGERSPFADWAAGCSVRRSDRVEAWDPAP